MVFFLAALRRLLILPIAMVPGGLLVAASAEARYSVGNPYTAGPPVAVVNAACASQYESLLLPLRFASDPAIDSYLVSHTRDLTNRAINIVTPEEARAFNEKQLQIAREILYHRGPRGPGRFSIDWAEAHQIYDTIKHHPVAAMCHLDKYDPVGVMKLCYGRAFAVHLEAVLKRGVANDSVLKVWAVGHLSAPWAQSFHTAAMIRGPDATWIVIDENLANPMPLEHWLAHMREIDDNRTPNMQILFTPPDRLIETRDRGYAPEVLVDPRWNGFFTGVMDTYR